MKSVLVTTGATVPFIPLLELFLLEPVQEVLVNLGYTNLVIQYGHAPEELVSKLLKSTTTTATGTTGTITSNKPKLKISGFSFKSNISEEVDHHDLIISHAGKNNQKFLEL